MNRGEAQHSAISNRQSRISNHTIYANAKPLRQRTPHGRADFADLNRDARVVNSIDASSSPPTADQLWQLEQLWERAPMLIEQLNGMITERMPALNQLLNEHGIRPKVGEAVALPKRPS